jgi:hypothetical protein
MLLRSRSLPLSLYLPPALRPYILIKK